MDLPDPGRPDRDGDAKGGVGAVGWSGPPGEGFRRREPAHAGVRVGEQVSAVSHAHFVGFHQVEVRRGEHRPDVGADPPPRVGAGVQGDEARGHHQSGAENGELQPPPRPICGVERHLVGGDDGADGLAHAAVHSRRPQDGPRHASAHRSVVGVRHAPPSSKDTGRAASSVRRAGVDRNTPRRRSHTSNSRNRSGRWS